MYYLCSENKALISLAVIAKPICTFVNAYIKCWFSYDLAQISGAESLQKTIFRVSEQVQHKPAYKVTEES